MRPKTRYVSMCVEVGTSGIVVRLRNAELEQQRVYEDRQQASHGFEEAGINATIRAAGFSLGRLRNEANNALDTGRRTTIISLGEQGEEERPAANAERRRQSAAPQGGPGAGRGRCPATGR